MIINYQELLHKRKSWQDKRVVFCSGSFDLTHAGHVLFLEDCKRLGDILLAMVGDDAAIQKHKGLKRPILNEHIRLKTIAGFKPVDFCFLNPHTETGLEQLAHLERVLVEIMPDIYAFNNDVSDSLKRQEITQRLGIETIILPRWCPPEFENISTTKLVEKIINAK